MVGGKEISNIKFKKMGIIYFLAGCTICLALFFLGLFFWTQRNGQNEDLYTPSVRMLFDDELPIEEKNS